MGLVTPQDVLSFGLIPELIGRLPIITPLLPLNTQQMVRILTEPRNAITKQYQHLFELEGASLEFTPDALEALAQQAMERGTGARALRAVNFAVVRTSGTRLRGSSASSASTLTAVICEL